MNDIENQLTTMLRNRGDNIEPTERLDEIRLLGAVTPTRAKTSPLDFEPTSSEALTRSSPRWALWTATAACLAILVAGFGVVATRDGSQNAASSEPVATDPALDEPVAVDGPALFDASTSEGTRTLRRGRVEGSNTFSGAVLSPSGAVFGLNLTPAAPDGLDQLGDPTYDARTIGGLSVGAVIDGTAPEQIYREIAVDCATLHATTAGEEMWGPETQTLVQSIALASNVASLDLPAGWASLGVGSVDHVYFSDLSATIDGSETAVSMWQAVGVPVGFYLSSMETPPTRLPDNDKELWHIASATTPTYNTVVGESNGTSFRVSAEAPLDDLLAVIESLDVEAESAWLQQPTEDPTVPADTIDPMTEEGTLPTCGLDTLAITTD